MDQLNPKTIQECIQTARDAGSPKDQVEQLIQAKYIPLPWQWEFHAQARMADKDNGPVDIGLGGARGPGKSHAVLSQAALDDCQRIDNLKGLFLRQTGIAAKESFDDLVNKVVLGHVPFTRSSNQLRFTNNSRIILGGFKDENDIDKYIGIEYDFIIVEELNQLTEEKYTKLRGSLRTSKPDWRPRMYTSFNPGGIGHAFVRDRYVMPAREGRQKETIFIGSTYKSNPHLNKEYIEYLEGLQGDLGKAWREGEWELFAGQVFSDFRYNTHVIDPVVPSKKYPVYLWIDWGYSEKSAFAAYLSAEIEEQIQGVKYTRVLTFKEFYGNQKSPDVWAKEIYDFCKQNKIEIYKGYTDPAMHAPETSGATDIATQMISKWESLNSSGLVRLEKGQNSGPASRVNRVGMLHNWLSIAPDGLPYWVITSSCKDLIRTLPMLVYDDNKVDEWDTTQEDHCLLESTEVITYNGVRRIGDLVGETGRVLSINNEWVEFYNCKKTRKNARLVKVTFDDGHELICTPDHKVLTTEGMIEAQDLKRKECVSTLSRQQYKNLMVSGTTGVESILEEMGSYFIGSFGHTTVQSQKKGCTYIIRMVTEIITRLKTLYRWMYSHIYRFMGNFKRLTESIWKELGRKLSSGTGQKKGEGGIESITRKWRRNSMKRNIRRIVKHVTGCFQWLLKEMPSVQMLVMQSGGEIQELIMLRKDAQHVVRISAQTNTEEALLVHGYVVRNCVQVEKLKERADTYCLTAKKYHMFSLVNGVIVSNSADSVTYGFSKIRFVDALRGVGGVKKRQPFMQWREQNGRMESIAVDLDKFKYAKPDRKRDWQGNV